jgi:hypothetical protein
MARIALIVMLALCARPALAHDTWSNGVAVPEWVRHSCCGPEDVHHLKKEQVHEMADGYHIDGYPYVIPYAHTLPSEDGDYWVFYRHNVGHDNHSGQSYESFSPVYCFFVPPELF